ncbi:hypothetical protein AMTRI_Chr04g242540 [Amborella trichopoda]|uniref:homeobox-leucine zipper protein HOX3 n=1 Tax=Amborella trichopoda TaxID=13333 RepID=UPI0009BEF4A6|nr:homeobox-leucine zipper protein HOX3 [Amborella trichopoda]|eukprot:XP_020526014.1 homeobox-leucine zipper protein HOX3 [Amborella trichopoda]
MMVVSTSLDLTMAMPGSSASGTPPTSELLIFPRGFDINEPPYEDARAVSAEEDEESGGGGGPPRKKLRLTKEQARLLEESFKENHTLNPKQKEELSIKLNLRSRQVEVWFQNRRARTKLKQTEMECEYLKRCFGSLTEENKRLQREVEQLRALRAPPPTVVSLDTRVAFPASTLTMCPRCERVSSTALDDNGLSTLSFTNLPKPSTLYIRQPSAAC